MAAKPHSTMDTVVFRMLQLSQQCLHLNFHKNLPKVETVLMLLNSEFSQIKPIMLEC